MQPQWAKFYIKGDPRLIITPFLTSLNTLWVRVHNSITDKLQNLNPSWNDENLNQESRRVVAALIQHITYKEYLPLVLGKAMMDEKNLNILKKDHLQTYQPSHDATNANAFVAAAFRFGHTMVGGKFKLPKRKPMTLLESFSEAKSVKNAGTRPFDFLEGMANTLSNTLDTWFTPHFHNSFAATLSSEIDFDIGVISIKV
ncbi:hypothetical protein Pcinc_003224 [Petrolisthes cinctipes]|uniref:Uncharacterized protein n=1 Tax=Petrolisthes cinctipes TaxID=88211 RepID=A0AAE1GGP1_PETCI|nr:hypothetical protein Pcinc_003224 [Petrolisthes cinctipes]